MSAVWQYLSKWYFYSPPIHHVCRQQHPRPAPTKTPPLDHDHISPRGPVPSPWSLCSGTKRGRPRLYALFGSRRPPIVQARLAVLTNTPQSKFQHLSILVWKGVPYLPMAELMPSVHFRLYLFIEKIWNGVLCLLPSFNCLSPHKKNLPFSSYYKDRPTVRIQDAIY